MWPLIDGSVIFSDKMTRQRGGQDMPIAINLMMIIIIIMSMGLDYVSELQTPTGLLFIPR
jgi:hypothetical protein